MTETSRGPVVAIDGPASSGKSTVGARVAEELGLRFVDTGLLYRALTWLALREAVPLTDGAAVAALAGRVTLTAEEGGRLESVLVDDEDVTSHVRDAAVERHVSEVARQPEVRAALLERQRALAADGGIVVAGRDIGTVVLPEADVKVFLEASAEERARRRAEQRGIAPESEAGAAILADLRARDDLDRNRATAPLRAADDAVRLVTDRNELEDTVAAVVEVVRRAIAASVPAPEPAAAAATQTKPVAARPPAPSKREEAPLGDHVTPFIALTNLVGRTITRSVAHLKVEGLEQPLDIDGPLIIVANHASNTDGVLVACWLTPALGRRVYLLGKQEALEWPFIGWALGRNAVVGVRRGAADLDAFRAARRVLDEGHVLAVFPEGTRSPNGRLQEAKEGIAILALRTGAPILPVGISGTHAFWPRGQKLFRPGGRLRMRVGRPFHLDPVEGGGRKAAQQAATRQIMTRIAELLPPSIRGAYADDVERAGGV